MIWANRTASERTFFLPLFADNVSGVITLPVGENIEFCALILIELIDGRVLCKFGRDDFFKTKFYPFQT